MKELTIEQKAQRYDEALEKAKDFYKGYKQRDNQLYTDDLESIFPELKESKESKDEKIRKELLAVVNDLVLPNEQQSRFVAWLEKQGEKKTEVKYFYTKFRIGDVIVEIKPNGYCQPVRVKYISEGDYSCESDDGKRFLSFPIISQDEYKLIDQKSVEFDDTNAKRMFIKALERVEEQNNKGYKLTDCDKNSWWEDFKTYISCIVEHNVEPKFHEGEWITNGDYTWKIVEVKPLDYILQSQDGNIVDDTISHVDEQFHSFTIEDARDGDVLALNDKTIVIFKDLYSSITFHAYCYVKEGTFSVSQDDIPDWWNSEGFYPATKEQSDNLMKAMTDAGWEFDLDRKELKKIEQKPIEWHREDEQNLNACLGYIPDEYLRRWLTDTIHVKYDNPAWSEEDEAKRNALISLIEEIKNQPLKRLEDWDGYISWLKSLRPQPKNEWGEWGKKYIASTIKMVEHCNFSSIGGITKAAAITWLKSLEPQTTWKPTEEQIETLEYYMDADISNKDKEVLFDLYKQIKQL